MYCFLRVYMMSLLRVGTMITLFVFLFEPCLCVLIFLDHLYMLMCLSVRQVFVHIIS